MRHYDRVVVAAGNCDCLLGFLKKGDDPKKVQLKVPQKAQVGRNGTLTILFGFAIHNKLGSYLNAALTVKPDLKPGGGRFFAILDNGSLISSTTDQGFFDLLFFFK